MTDVVARQPIILTLTTAESLYVLDAVNERAARAHEHHRMMVATGAPDEEREVSETAAVLLDRVARRLDGQLYRVCRFLSEVDCTAPVTWFDNRGVPYCQMHAAKVRAIAEALETAALPW